MIKIAFTSIFYPLFMGRYILEAFKRRDDVEIWTAGPFSGRWIPWGGGMHLPPSYVLTPDFALPSPQMAQNEISYRILEKRAPWEPDLWLEVNSTLKASGRPSSGVYAVVGTDPHVLDYTAQRKAADRFFCMQRPYMESGDIWLPYGYDPVWHSPTPIPAAERTIDCALIGLQYGEREKLFRRLNAEGKETRFELGPSYEDARAIYHQTKIGINWSSRQDTTARVFEIMAFGIAPVINRVPDLMDMFKDGEDFLGFDNQDEAVAQIDRCLNDLDFCDRLGKQAREAVEADHSWDARADQILRDCGLVSDTASEDA